MKEESKIEEAPKGDIDMKDDQDNEEALDESLQHTKHVIFENDNYD